MYPDDLSYTTEHEWLRQPGRARGLGPRRDHPLRAGRSSATSSTSRCPSVGDTIEAGSTCGELESTKSVSDVYAPVSGEVVARNESLDATPELVNNDPYGGGWLFEVVPSDPSQLEGLLDSAAYQASLGG